MSDLTKAMHRYVRRYQRALLLKGLLVAGLGGAALLILGWRLHGLRLEPPWLRAVPWLAAGAGLAGLGWWLRRRWLSRAAAVRSIDDALGLEQRLVTAAEFEAAAKPPVLYAALLADTMSRFSTFRQHTPRLLDRTTGVLALLLLFLLLWPVAGIAPIQFVRAPDRLTPQPDEVVPPESDPDSKERSRTGQSPQAQGGGQQEEEMPSSGDGDGDRDQEPSSGEPSSQQADASDQGEASKEPSGDSQGETSGEQQTAQSASERGGETEPQEGAKGREHEGRDTAEDRRGGQDQQEAAQQAQAGADRRASQAGQDDQQRMDQRADADETSPRDGKHGESPERQADAGQQQGGKASAEVSPSGGEQAVSAGNQQALKEGIQELLKELQGELKEMQAQLASIPSDQSNPRAGTGTDPELYGDSSLPEAATRVTLPIQLETDTAPTATERQGSGTGTPSGEIARTGPTLSPESAALSDRPSVERATRRRVIPPDYQPVFERLYQRSTN